MSKVPTGTYRLQLRPGFGFAEATGIVDYLAALGVSHVYLSPILQATAGSAHGYDVVDHSQLSSDLGGEQGFRQLVETLRSHGMGVVVDIVPNHMAFESHAVRSVVEHGRDSQYAHWFDIDWEAADHLVIPGQGEPNYRRFFDISGLIALRQEDRDVFEATHATLFRLHDLGLIDGFRIDHVDGLSDPALYLRWLTERTDAWIVIEKILTASETVPEEWVVRGTTGYDAGVVVDGLFVDPDAEQPLTELYTRLTGGPSTFPGHEGKRYVAEHGLAPEVARLHRMLVGLMPKAQPGHLRGILLKMLVDFPAYRSYRLPEDPEWRDFAIRFQQTTAPLAARGVEDTAFYRWSRLVSRNEVGGEPDRFSVSQMEFHRYCSTGGSGGMTTLSTHDSKRQEDVRARLALLSEFPAEWEEFVTARCDGSDFDYLLWQTLVGAWPLDQLRLEEYLIKAMREAKTHTNWMEQNHEYEAAILDRARKALEDPAVAEFALRLAPYERVNVLSQKLVQLTMVGVPDVYQGCELTGYALVDPDNRRPVDYGLRRALLTNLDAGQKPKGLDEEKLLVTSRTLRLRLEHPDWFQSFHVPLTAEGPGAEHVVAFRRGDAVTIATRLPRGLERKGGWQDTVLQIPDGTLRDAFTGREHTRLADLLATYPVALLVPED